MSWDYNKKRDIMKAKEGVKNYRNWIYGLQKYEDIIEDIVMDENAGSSILLEDFKKLKEIYKKEDLSSIIRYFEREIDRLHTSIVEEDQEELLDNMRKNKRPKVEENKENEQKNELDKEDFNLNFLDDTVGGRKKRRTTRKKVTKKRKTKKSYKK